MSENENKQDRNRYIVIVVLVCIVCLVFTAQLINWQIVNGAQYFAKAESNSQYFENVPAARGEIVDANGVGLAVNNITYDVAFNKIYMAKGTENEIILKLVNLFSKNGQPFVDDLPITINGDGNYEFLPDREKDINYLKSTYRLNSYASASDCIDKMASKECFDCSNLNNAEKRYVVSVRYNMVKKGYTYGTTYEFATGITSNMLSIITENSQKLQGVQIEENPNRKYINGTSAPHIVGTIGAISQEEYEKNKGNEKYKLNSKIGKSGIEQAYEDTLIGTDGKRRVETTKDGSVINTYDVDQAASGDTVYLTIDSRLQDVARDALEANCKAAQSKAKEGENVTGSVVMLDPKDFSVLCAQSYPSFDLSQYIEDKEYYNSLVSDESRKPLFARAFEGSYPIGSSMKPAVALAALEEGAITPSTTFVCNHTYMRFAPDYKPTCMGTHGSLSLDRALAVSCNIYFFETGFHLGINDMNLYQTRMGFGQKTGVEITERVGVLAGRREREAAGGTWYDGDTIAAAIGQSDNLVTPVQLATYCATIANGGTRMRTHLVKKITDYSRQTVKREITSQNIEVKDTLGVSEKNVDIVKSDMRGVVTRPDGTARNTLGSYPVPIAAKTGTAQVYKNNTSQLATDHTTLIAFAPYDDPKVAIGIVLEHGGQGVYCANIAKAIFDEYFKNNPVDSATMQSSKNNSDSGISQNEETDDYEE